jgi:esterase/lipase
MLKAKGGTGSNHHGVEFSFHRLENQKIHEVSTCFAPMGGILTTATAERLVQYKIVHFKNKKEAFLAKEYNIPKTMTLL